MLHRQSVKVKEELEFEENDEEPGNPLDTENLIV